MKPLNLEETRLKEEMKQRCLSKGQYIDENAKAKFEMLCHLEDFEVQYWELQQENKQLKEQLLATQTNGETFRLEMKDITQTLGLDEDTIFDDVKAFVRSLKENKILRENAEHNDKVVDNVNWENMLLKKENQELKKQLEEYQEELEKADSITQSCIFNGKKESEISYRKCLNMLEKHKNQQKKFIEYLEDKIYSIEPKGTGINYNCEYDSEEDYVMAMQEQSRLNTLKEILSKYREIIGSDINVGSIGDKDEIRNWEIYPNSLWY